MRKKLNGNLRLAAGVMVGGLLIFGVALAFAFWDRSNVIESNCAAVNDVKSSLVQILDQGEAASLHTYHKLEERGRGFPGFTPHAIRTQHDRNVAKLQPSGC